MSSTSVLSSASGATIRVFDTVANTATALSKTIDGLGTGANMFHRMMTDMDANHKLRSDLHQANYKQTLLEETSKEMAKRQATLKKELEEDKDFLELYKENYKILEAILNPAKPE